MHIKQETMRGTAGGSSSNSLCPSLFCPAPSGTSGRHIPLQPSTLSPPVASSSSLLDRHTIFLRSCFRCAGARTCVWVYVCSYTCKSYGPQHSSVLGHWGATGALTARTKVSSSIYGACASPPPDIASWYRCVCVCVSQCPSVSRS